MIGQLGRNALCRVIVCAKKAVPAVSEFVS
jgi:hypothetical protein